MDKNQQIEEMEKDIGKAVGLTYEGEHFVYTLHTQKYLAKALYDADYRKQGDVVREFAGQAKERLSTLFGTDKNGFIIPTDYNGAVERCICEIIELAGEFCAKGE